MNSPEGGNLFRLPERFKTFQFDDGEWAGAEIVCRLSPIRLADILGTADKTVEDLIKTWAEIALVSWNLALPDGSPISCDLDGLEYLPIQTRLALIDAWLTEVGGIPVPLVKQSIAGVSSDPEPEPTSPPS